MNSQDILISRIMACFDRYRDDKKNCDIWYAILESDVIEVIEHKP
jgi:hypothetical protein